MFLFPWSILSRDSNRDRPNLWTWAWGILFLTTTTGSPRQMSALLGGSGNFTYAKSRTSEGAKRGDSGSSEDSSNNETKSALPGACQLGHQVETETNQQVTHIEFRPVGHGIPEYSPIGTSTQPEEYGLGKEAGF
ncbi:hypothetical protein RSAG8_06725, partial [Rhizoctonia solani AG-8 WAC10335]